MTYWMLCGREMYGEGGTFMLFVNVLASNEINSSKTVCLSCCLSVCLYVGQLVYLIPRHCVMLPFCLSCCLLARLLSVYLFLYIVGRGDES